MTAADVPPIPAELAVDEEPIPADLLAAWLAVGPVVMEVVGEDPNYAQVTRWRPEDDSAAEWAARKYAAARAELVGLQEQAAEWARRIEAWYDQRAKALDREASFFAGHLERYALAVREASGGKVKTLTLPSATVRTSETRPAVAVTDEAAVIEWAERNLEAEQVDAVVKVTSRVMVRELRKVARLVEYPTSVVLHCGCVLDGDGTLPAPGRVVDPAMVGSEWFCTSCGEAALIAQWRTTALVVVDEAGRRVPGTEPTEGRVDATVVLP